MSTVQDKGMSYGLKALHKLAASETIDKLGMRPTVEKMVYSGTKNGFKAVEAVGRQFAKKQGEPKRQSPAKPTGLFDLNPTEEQQMLQEAFGEFAMSELRPVAEQSDHDCAAPKELLDACNELGATMIGVPEELGGAVAERSAVTSVLIAEAMAQGDLGLAVAALAPSAVSTAIGLWGDGDQQATYLPDFVGENVPAAALAITEPRPVFDPAKLATKATRSPNGFTLTGAKSLVPRGSDAELFVVAADLEGKPALFIVEANLDGVKVAPEPAMGLRAAATARLEFEDVTLPATALLGGGNEDVYKQCIALSRIAWAAVAAGASQGALDFLIPYVNERVAFGEPISNRQAVAFKISDISIELGGLRLATYRAASLADAGKPFSREAAIARQLTAKYGMQIGSDAVQLLGGHGYVKEYPAERWYRDLRAAGLMEGALLV